MKIARLVACLLALLPIWAEAAATITVDSVPTQLFTDAQMPTTMDGSLVTVRRDPTTFFFYHTTHFLDCAYEKWIGTTSNPFQTLVWKKGDKFSLCSDKTFWTNQANSSSNPFPGLDTSGTMWLYNIYKVDPTHYLGFVHIERDGASTTCSGGQASSFQCMGVGLAYSSDAGDTWRFLGVIARAPQNSDCCPNGSGQNYAPMAGVPYIIVNDAGTDYFYIYYNEDRANGAGGSPIGVARAPVSTVIAAAQANTISTWVKRKNGTWSGNAFTDKGDDVIPTQSLCGSDSQTSETHAMAFNATLGKYVFFTAPQLRGACGIIYTSTDGVVWAADQAYAPAPPVDGGGFGLVIQNTWLVPNGLGDADDGHAIGDDFYVHYNLKGQYLNPSDAAHDEIYRKHVTIQQPVVNATSCSQTDVTAAIAQVADGGTVNVPAGTCTWTGQLTINKAITLQGAGIGQTVITDGRTNNGSAIAIYVAGSGSAVTRVTGFTFNGNGQLVPAGQGFINVDGCSLTTANYRIDNNMFNQIYNVAIRTVGRVFGVIDHNTYHGYPGTSNKVVDIAHVSWPRDGVNCTGQWSDGSWAAPLAPGSIQATYFETNTVYDGGTDSSLGTRMVNRYNRFVSTIQFAGISSHGTDSGQRIRGSRWLESYENRFEYPAGFSVDTPMEYRGGSGVAFNNKIYMVPDRSAGLNWVVRHHNYRSDAPFNPWGQCDGTQEWDGNTPGLNGYRCLDQPGAGTSVDWNDVFTAAGLGKAQNAKEPIYVWNNQVNDVPDNCGNQVWSCGSDFQVQASTFPDVSGDIIYGTPRPGYTPFVYPHPLVSGALTESFPTNGPITSGQNQTWTTFNSLAVSGGTAVATATGVSNRARAAASLTTANQSVEATVRFSSLTQAICCYSAAVNARYSTTAHDSIAFYLYTTDGGATYRAGGRGVVAGSNTVVYGADVVVAAGIVQAANLVRLEITGTSPNTKMVGYVNGTAVWSASGQSTASYDSNRQTGFTLELPTGGASSSLTLDDWSAGDLPGPIINGSVITAASCDQARVQDAFDVVTTATTRINIPAGTCHWVSTLTLTLPDGVGNITIAGAGDGAGTTVGCGNCATHILNDNPVHNSLLYVAGWANTNPSQVIRVSGLEIKPGIGTLQNDFIKVSGGVGQVRIDHNTLSITNTGGNQSGLGGNAIQVDVRTGVVDHNLMHGGITIHNTGGFGEGFGDTPWSQPTDFGGPNFVFIENNHWLPTAGGLDARWGGRYVARHNVADDVGLVFFVTHGTGDFGEIRTRGARAIEAYENTLATTDAQFSGNEMMQLYSGTALLWNNTHSGFVATLVQLAVIRTNTNLGVTEQPPPNGWGYCGTNFNGTGSNWDQNADVPSGYACMDMPGRGQGDLISGDFPNAVNTNRGNIVAWPRQALEPIYEWNNVVQHLERGISPANAPQAHANRDYYEYQGGAFNGSVGTGQGLKSRIVSGGDLFGSCTAGPGGNTPGVAYFATDERKLYVCNPTNTWTLYYTPYTYPHPLVSGAPPAPILTLTIAGSGTVTSSPSGISCPTTCSSAFPLDSAATLTATPSAGSTFAGWSGGVCSGTGPCVVTMSADKAVTATFSQGSVIAAANCTQQAVTDAIALAPEGGTVTIPFGDCTWTQNLTINKRLNLVGNGDGAGSTRGSGNNPTTIRDGTTPNNFNGHILTWNVPNTGLSTMSGINWGGSCVNNDHIDGIMTFFGDGLVKSLRIHHNSFFPCGTVAMKIYNIAGGVVDHNVFHVGFGRNSSYYLTPQWGGVGDFGDYSYAQPSSLGTDNAMYYEDNDYLADNVNEFTFTDDGWMGHRAVYRYNHYVNTQGANGHGTDSAGRWRGFRHHEVYENDWVVQSNLVIDRVTGFRGGTGMMFNNRAVVDPGGFLSGIANIGVDRAGTSNHYEFWGRCGKYNVNLTSSGTVATATITDTDDGNGNGFNLTGDNGGLPLYVQFTNATDSRYNGIWPVVTPAPFGQTFQFTIAQGCPSGTCPATGLKMAPWDQNSDGFGYACLDQSGRGQGEYMGGTYLPTQTPSTPHWPNQALEPIYIWNNTFNGVLQGVFGGDGAGALASNRDFYNQGNGIGVGAVASRPACTTTGFAWWATDQGSWNTTKPANTSGRLYKCTVPNWATWYGPNNNTGEPLTYPHPLVSGSTPTPPAPVGGVTIGARPSALLTVSLSGQGTVTGTGIACSPDCTQNYDPNTIVALTATPASGWTFTGWAGAGCSGTGSCSVTMSQARIVQAGFAQATNINMAWDHDGLNLTGFGVERATPCTTGTFGVIGTPGAAIRALTDTTTTPGLQYMYRVQAFNGTVASAYSGTICTNPAPYSSSTLLAGVLWDFANARLHLADGSDLWPGTITTNGTFMMGWGDGGGMAGSDTLCRAHMGLHQVTGTAPNFVFNTPPSYGCQATGIGCLAGATHAPTCDAPANGSAAPANAGVPQSLLAVNNTLYVSAFEGAQVRIYSSTDFGHTWTASNAIFPWTNGNPVPIAFLQFGPGYAGNTDGFVYLYTAKKADFANTYLARVPVAQITTLASWQYYNNTSQSNWGTWAQATPVHTDSNNLGDGFEAVVSSAQWFPLLGRYIITMIDGALSRFRMYDAINPWGPWTTVVYDNNWGPNGTAYTSVNSALSFNIQPNIGTDNTFWMTFSGSATPTPSWDNYNLIKGSFILR